MSSNDRGLPDQIALHLIASQQMQYFRLLFGLDTFGDHLELHCVRQRDDGRYQRQSTRIIEHGRDKRPIDLQFSSTGNFARYASEE